MAAAATSTSLVGTAIDEGTLLLVDILGSGHSGIVYRAHDLNTPSPHTQYAVKCLSNLKNIAHRDNEINLHCAVAGHPSILSIHRIIETDELVFLVMDLCTGGDLWSAVTERHIYWKKDELVRSAFLQIVEAVEYCHNIGIYHRDIKLENILCSRDGSKVWLGDFGLATTDTISFQFGVGTQYYISPECLAGQEHPAGPYSPASNDIWSLGVVLINMLTGLCAWNSASLRNDDYFRDYCTPGSNHLRTLLPISREADLLIRHILCVDPWYRITLAQLKEDVKAVKTFFMTDAEIALAPERVRASAATQQPAPATNSDVLESRERHSDERRHGRVFSSSSDSGLRELIATTSSLSTVSLSSGGSTTESRGRPATPEGVPIPTRCLNSIDECHENEENLPLPCSTARPPLKKDGSTKTLKENASRTFQAVLTRLRAF